MSSDPADTAEARSRRANVDDLIVVIATVALFLVLTIFSTAIVGTCYAVLGIKPDDMGGLVALAIIVPITIAFSWLLARGLRRSAEKRMEEREKFGGNPGPIDTNS